MQQALQRCLRRRRRRQTTKTMGGVMKIKCAVTLDHMSQAESSHVHQRNDDEEESVNLCLDRHALCSIFLKCTPPKSNRKVVMIERSIERSHTFCLQPRHDESGTKQTPLVMHPPPDGSESAQVRASLPSRRLRVRRMRAVANASAAPSASSCVVMLSPWPDQLRSVPFR